LKPCIKANSLATGAGPSVHIYSNHHLFFKRFYHANIITRYVTNGKRYYVDELVCEGKDLIYTNQLFWFTNK